MKWYIYSFFLLFVASCLSGNPFLGEGGCGANLLMKVKVQHKYNQEI